MADQIGDLLTHGLPPTYPNGCVRKVMAVTAGDVQRVARTYFDPDIVDIVVVGDVARLRAGTQALGFGPVTLRNLEGKQLTP